MNEGEEPSRNRVVYSCTGHVVLSKSTRMRATVILFIFQYVGGSEQECADIFFCHLLIWSSELHAAAQVWYAIHMLASHPFFLATTHFS
jgi:hypothetical protein